MQCGWQGMDTSSWNGFDSASESSFHFSAIFPMKSLCRSPGFSVRVCSRTKSEYSMYPDGDHFLPGFSGGGPLGGSGGLAGSIAAAPAPAAPPASLSFFFRLYLRLGALGSLGALGFLAAPAEAGASASGFWGFFFLLLLGLSCGCAPKKASSSPPFDWACPHLKKREQKKKKTTKKRKIHMSESVACRADDSAGQHDEGWRERARGTE